LQLNFVNLTSKTLQKWNMKKSWHPLLIKNQERVWKEEQKALEEQKKLTQLMKEKEEERQLQELRKLQESAGGRKGPERLDWMYAAGPNQSSSAKAQELEDFLLGKKSVGKLIDNSTALSKLSESKDVFTSAMNPNANSYRDTQSKIREDPLLLIKKTEQANIKAIFTNPIKMKELKEIHIIITINIVAQRSDIDLAVGPRLLQKSDIDLAVGPRLPQKRDIDLTVGPRLPQKGDTVLIVGPRLHQKGDIVLIVGPRLPHGGVIGATVLCDGIIMRGMIVQKLQQMMDDAKKLKEDRKKRVDDINREEKEEEIKVAEHKKRTFESGSYSEYLKNAYKDAYSSSSSFDLGERVRRHRGTLQKAGE
ncbi:2348_t:CDS:2, partial [Gigaspora margarita]